MCALQKEAIEGWTKKMADQFLLWAYTCVFLNTHMSGAEQVNGSFDHFQHDTHLLQKMLTEGWPPTCCCEHTHVVCRIV